MTVDEHVQMLLWYYGDAEKALKTATNSLRRRGLAGRKWSPAEIEHKQRVQHELELRAELQRAKARHKLLNHPMPDEYRRTM